MDTFWIILILMVASVSGTALIALAIHRGRRNTESLKALCQERGWYFEPETRPGGDTMRISDTNAGWHLDITHVADRTGSGPGARRTVWTDPRAGVPAGLAVAAPTLPASKAEGVERAMSAMGGRMGSALVARMFGALGPDATRLQAVETRGGTGLMMATPEARDALAPIADHPALREAAAQLKTGDMPAILRNPDGLHLRVQKAWTDPRRVAMLADLGEGLSASLRD